MNGLDKLIKKYESRLELATELRDEKLKKVLEKADALKSWMADAELYDMVYCMENQIVKFKAVCEAYEKACDDRLELEKTLKELKELAEEGEQK